MKKLFSIMAIAAVVALSTFTAKANNAQTTLPVQVQQIVANVDTGATFQQEAADEEVSFTQDLKKRFIEGGAGFMGIVLLCLILGLAIAIERIIYLNLASTNTKKLAIILRSYRDEHHHHRIDVLRSEEHRDERCNHDPPSREFQELPPGDQAGAGQERHDDGHLEHDAKGEEHPAEERHVVFDEVKQLIVGQFGQ